MIYKIEYGKAVKGNRVVFTNNGTISIGNNVLLNSYPGGELVSTGIHAYFSYSKVIIGQNCILNGTMIYCRSRVTILANCMFGPGVKIIDNDSHRVSINSSERRKAPITIPVCINENVWVGANSLILKGVTIGENSIIAAHSVVTKDIPKNTLVAGNPAKVIRELKK